MTASVLPADRVLEWVREHYAFADPVECVVLRSELNDVYAVGAGGRRYALRVGRPGWRSREDVENEAAAVEHIAAKGVSVARPVMMRDGTAVGAIDAPGEARNTIMFEWLPGDSVGEANVRQCVEIGRLTGEIHRASDDLPAGRLGLSVGARWIEEDPGSAIASVVPDPNDADLIRSAVAMGKAVYSGWPKVPPFWGFVHGDLAEHNILFDQGTLHVFDFEGCGAGWRTDEVIGWLLRQGGRGLADEAWKARCEAYLSGYRETRKLEPFEVDAYRVNAAVSLVAVMDITVRIVPEVPLQPLLDKFLPRLRQMSESGFTCNELISRGVRI